MLRLARWREQRYQEWLAAEPSPVVKRIRAIKAQREQELLNRS
jgi:hypothetical protein